jgi:hypothetical protein
MATIPDAPTAAPPATPRPAGTPAPRCLNCGAPLGGAYCAACGQQALDLAAPTWHVVRDALADATELDGRVVRTARALAVPGLLTTEFLRGRRAPYLSPLKVFLLAGTLLTTTWIATRGADARYYGFAPDGSAGMYIDTVVRGSMAAILVVALGSWLLGRARRRLLDEAVFAVHVVAALSTLASVVVLLGTAWKLAWGSVSRVPSGVPALPYLLFLPAAVLGLAYLARALHRVHGGAWWAAVLRAVVLGAAGFAAVTGMLLWRAAWAR